MGGSVRRPVTALLCLAAFVPLCLISPIWARDRGAALSQSIYFLALFSLPLLLPTGRNERRQIANAFAVAVLLSSVYGMLQALGLDWPAHYASPSEPVSTPDSKRAGNAGSGCQATSRPVAGRKSFAGSSA